MGTQNIFKRFSIVIILHYIERYSADAFGLICRQILDETDQSKQIHSKNSMLVKQRLYNVLKRFSQTSTYFMVLCNPGATWCSIMFLRNNNFISLR